MKYQQIKPKKIYEEVTDALVESIRSGDLLPGEKLDSVQTLSESFQVSRSAVREALSALKAIGLIEMKQGEGTYVKQFNPDQLTFSFSQAILMSQRNVLQLHDVRSIIEIGVVKKAALHRTEDDLYQLSHALEQMKRAEINQEVGEETDLAFHLALATASQNEILVSLVNQISMLLVETLRENRKEKIFSQQSIVQQLYIEHEQIYQAVMTKQPEEAEKAMIIHLEHVQRLLSDVLQEPIEPSHRT
ncbi:FadR/GntR family transcriptional regulator [Bacillus sp. 179-C3.3 HS]|uniref:FadR/GntR family transcriptional regulator n=1 Tax=Bacillus sp. 179-C3.3 HS TaxID=3232162 RepID=UPI0039A2A387